MQNIPDRLNKPLTGLGWAEWLDRAEEAAGEDGYVEHLGANHAAVFVEAKSTLLVSFENHPRLSLTSKEAHPLGWDMVKALGWSHLCLLSDGDTWFRDRRVYGYFDRLVDDGFFDEFDQVIFYGAGPCGYAAAAFSVAAPGARVLALQPQATLDPRVTEWDDRFPHMRRTAFDDRYGYAPDMLDAAAATFVLYDPEEELDAMHAALFTRPDVTKVRTRFFGPEAEVTLRHMKVLLRMLAQLSVGKLTTLSLAQMLRARHDLPGYQFALLKRLTADKRPLLVTRLCHHVLAQREAPPFRRALQQAEAQLAAQTLTKDT